MDKREIEELREKVRCGVVLERCGWKIDRAESTKRAVKYRRGAGEIIIVTHEGQGWFDPLSDAKGDVFSLVEHLDGYKFVDALRHIGSLIGFSANQPALKRPLRRLPQRPLAARWQERLRPAPGSLAWRYLTNMRALTVPVLQQAVAKDVLREGPQGSIWAAHRDGDGIVVGWEERGPDWRGFSSGGGKDLFRFGADDPERICVTEAAIDALSLAAIEGIRWDTIYVSTGGGWAPATVATIANLAADPRVTIVAATDSNRQGDIYAQRLFEITERTGCAYVRLTPRDDDWNNDLRARRQRVAV